jgi:glutamate-5-semialdehyde dehydrogenase
VPSTDREAVRCLLSEMRAHIDVLIPRGGKSLVERVQREARVPVIGHLDGNCHIYIDASADPAMALAVVLNAKLRRTGVCGALESLLIHAALADSLAPKLVAALLAQDCEIRGDAAIQAVDPRVRAATETDWSTEYLAKIISIKLVNDTQAAIDHINHYGSHHTDAIISEHHGSVQLFLRRVDSAIVIHNASTQFADGSEFGFGAEIGIATDRLHARGPVGIEQLTSYQYRIHGHGQIRPL